MSDSNIKIYEDSPYGGSPVECYQFEYDGVVTNYTSADTDITIELNGTTQVFYHTYIKRDAVKPGSGSDGVASTVVYVQRNNNIAMLYQGSPPEQGRVKLHVYRLHRQDMLLHDSILVGSVSQVTFDGSEAEITITQESYLNKEIPVGKLQYYCNNRLFDHRCKLNIDAYKKTMTVDYIKGLTIKSAGLLEFPEGYFINGMIKFGSNTRAIATHVGNTITIKYPLADSAHVGQFDIVPGCDSLFSTCANKFANTDNFTGCPYTPPTDSVKNPTGKGVYWVDSLVVVRDTNGFIGKIDL